MIQWEDHEVSSMTVISQLWQKSGSCPKKTIPIRRIRRSDLLKAANSVENYGRKKPSFLHKVAQPNGSQKSNLLQMNHSVLSLTLNFENFTSFCAQQTHFYSTVLLNIALSIFWLRFMWIRRQHWWHMVTDTWEQKEISKFVTPTLSRMMSTVLPKFVLSMALTMILRALKLDGR